MEPKPVEWVKSNRDTIAALVAAGAEPSLRYLKLLLRTMRTGVPTMADISGLEELVCDELIFESDEGVIPSCVIESSASCHKTSEARLKAWKTRKSLINHQTDSSRYQADIKPTQADITLNETRETRETREKDKTDITPISSLKTRRKSSDLSIDFAEFWDSCPKKAGKLAAIKAWDKAITISAPHEIISGMKAYAQASIGKEDRFIKTPGPWLNDGRWMDDNTSSRRDSNSGKKDNDYTAN